MGENEAKSRIIKDGTGTTVFRTLTLEEEKELYPSLYGSYEEGVRINQQPKRMIGFKPHKDDPDVVVHALPGSSWSVRIWPGGLAYANGCCFDFLQGGVAVNNPDEWKIISVPKPTDPFPHVVKMKSAEKSMGFRHPLPGMEKYFGKQGVHYRIDFHDKEKHSVIFVTPRFTALPPVPEFPAATGGVYVP